MSAATLSALRADTALAARLDLVRHTELLPEVDVGQRELFRDLGVRHARAVPALRVLEVVERNPHRFHLRGHLARVSGMDAIVARRRGEHHGRVLRAWLQVLVW